MTILILDKSLSKKIVNPGGCFYCGWQPIKTNRTITTNSTSDDKNLLPNAPLNYIYCPWCTK